MGLLLLIPLLLGVISTALTFNDYLSVDNATRDSARYASSVDYSSGATAWADNVQTRAQQAYYNSASTLSTSQICVQLVQPSTATVLATPTTQGSSCSGSVPASPSNVPSGTCLVKVWIAKPSDINIGIASWSMTVSSKSIGYYGRAAGVCTTP